MIDKYRRDKLYGLTEQAERIMDSIDTDDQDFITAMQICRTVISDVREACIISEKCDAALIERLERIRRMYDTGE